MIDEISGIVRFILLHRVRGENKENAVEVSESFVRMDGSAHRVILVYYGCQTKYYNYMA